jgi:hypothetical protein
MCAQLLLALALSIAAEISTPQSLFCHTQVPRSDPLYPSAELICQNCTTAAACNAQAARAVKCAWESPPPGTVTVTSWTALGKGVAACKENCSFELAKGFTTPVEGFTTITIGDNNSSSPYTQNISIDGNGVAVIDAHGKDKIFDISDGSSLSITGVTLQNGKPRVSQGVGGAITSFNGNLELVGCILKKNAGYLGGALWLSSSKCTIDSCTFEENLGTILGGAIWAANGVMTVVACTFDFNAVATLAGGAIWVDPQQSVTIFSSAFNGNAGGQSGGGAVVVVNTGSVTIISSTFKGGDGDERIDSVLNNGQGTVTFACPPNSTGKPVSESAEKEFLVGELPPAKEIANCTAGSVFFQRVHRVNSAGE